MYAIIETGGKQYRVREGDLLHVDLLEEESGAVCFDQVLMLQEEVGQPVLWGAPYLNNCKVEAEILGQAKGPKVIAFKYKKCKNYRRTRGHRQKYSTVRIKKISAAQ